MTQKLSEYPRASRKFDLPVLQWYRYCLICDPLRLRLPCGYGPPQARPLQMLSEVFIEDTRLWFNLFKRFTCSFRAFALEREIMCYVHSSGIISLNSLGFQSNMKGQLCKVWDGLHVAPRTAPSKRAKLCTYFAWFLWAPVPSCGRSLEGSYVKIPFP